MLDIRDIDKVSNQSFNPIFKIISILPIWNSNYVMPLSNISELKTKE